jgi:hypothetical protein
LETQESLTTIAEIAIALAGFSGLVVVLRKNNGPLTAIEKYRMTVLLATAFGALFLALLPATLQQLALSGDVIWKTSSALLTAFSIIFVVSWVLSSRRFFHVAREIFNVAAFSLMIAGHLTNVVLQMSIVFGFWADRMAGAYLLGLIWLLAHSSQQFVRMLFIQPMNLDVGNAE